jgi:hypothetical protein
MATDKLIIDNEVLKHLYNKATFYFDNSKENAEIVKEKQTANYSINPSVRFIVFNTQNNPLVSAAANKLATALKLNQDAILFTQNQEEANAYLTSAKPLFTWVVSAVTQNKLLSPKLSPYKMDVLHNKTYLLTDDFDTLDKDPVKKTILWNSLKQHFSQYAP